MRLMIGDHNVGDLNGYLSLVGTTKHMFAKHLVGRHLGFPNPLAEACLRFTKTSGEYFRNEGVHDASCLTKVNLNIFAEI